MNERAINTRQTMIMTVVSFLLALCLVIGMIAVLERPAFGQDAGSDGYTYTVQDGDSWDTVAANTAISVDALKEVNPDSIRDSGWLLVGEKLLIPYASNGERVTHKVESGESWSTIAEDFGIHVRLLKVANQHSIRSGLILYKGETLTIPPAPPEEGEEAHGAAEELLIEDPFGADAEDEGEPTEASEDETAADAAEDTDEVNADEDEVDAENGEEEADTQEPAESADDAEIVEEPAETEADSDSGEAIEEPVEETVDEAADEAADEAQADDETADDGEAGTPVEEEPAAEDETDGDAEEPVAEEPAEDAVEDDEGSDEATPVDEEPVDEEPVAAPTSCPETLADYPDTVLAMINSAEGSPESLAEFLTECGSNMEDSVVAIDSTGDGSEELVVVYQNPSQESTFIESDLIILSPTEDGYDIAYRARAAGEVRLLSTGDMNEDGMVDVVWIDTTCGASTCFDTVNVRSWDGSVWSDWTDGTITMAYADIELQDSETAGGQDILLTGGIYGSVGAGPQRSRTELWSSVDGMPYSLAEKTYSVSECLYHTVVDANRAMKDTETEGYLDTAKALYERAVTDDTLIKCWVRPAELDELRSFSLFRLALIEAYNGNMDAAAARIAELTETYPDSKLVGAAQAWQDVVESDGDYAAACEAVTTFSEKNPETWEPLADYGYTNPSFDPSDLCPPPKVTGEDPEDAEQADVEEGATGASPRSDLETEPETEIAEDSKPELPDCPATLADFGPALPGVLAELDADQNAISEWLTHCGAMDEGRGAVLSQDLNGDEIADFIVFPTIVSDVGLGPDGAQGSVHILHGRPDGGFSLAWSPEVFGQPQPLAVDDLNMDGLLDIAWTVEGCSTFCVVDTQIVSWDGTEYAPMIEPGSAIAEGVAEFVSIADGQPGSGYELIVSGGVSGTPEGGLTTSHTETWQSIDGQPYRRIGWQYDRESTGSKCQGLRMIEADVALQASDVLGYDPAIELYNQALGPNLEACSIFGLRPDEELELLQGLASFRLIQAQALSGDVANAQSSMDLLTTGMPGSKYATLAQQWLTDFVASGNAEKACNSIASMLEENPELWQITDHFGYSHPALAAEQICFVPSSD